MNIQTGGDLTRGSFAESFLTEQGRRRIEYQLRRRAGGFHIAGPVRGGSSWGDSVCSCGYCLWDVARAVNRVLHASQGESRVVAHQSFRAHCIAGLNGLENCFMLPYSLREASGFRGRHNRGGRGESNGLNPIKRELQHRAPGERNESFVKRQIQFAETRHLPCCQRFRSPKRGRQLRQGSIGAARPFELDAIRTPTCRQTGRKTLEGPARLNGIRDVLPAENARDVRAWRQLFQQTFLV